MRVGTREGQVEGESTLDCSIMTLRNRRGLLSRSAARLTFARLQDVLIGKAFHRDVKGEYTMALRPCDTVSYVCLIRYEGLGLGATVN